MISHYIADAHMPFHCDSRPFSTSRGLHGKLEGKWEDEIEKHYQVDRANSRFLYNPDGYPLRMINDEYTNSLLHQVNENIANRRFVHSWGNGNSNVLDFMTAICQYSYLLSYSFIPENTDVSAINLDDWSNIPNQKVGVDELSVIVLSEAIESVARVWLRVWERYKKWLN